jgi:hypothetical protein
MRRKESVVIGIVTGVLALWCLLSLPIGLAVGRSMSIGTRVDSVRRRVASGRTELPSLRSVHL